jgi:hypothetical protein
MKTHYKRVFLNKERGVAAMTLELKKANDTEYSGTIEISDCNRVARLDMDFWTPKMKKERLAKLSKMIELLTEYRGLVEAADMKRF